MPKMKPSLETFAESKLTEADGNEIPLRRAYLAYRYYNWQRGGAEVSFEQFRWTLGELIGHESVDPETIRGWEFSNQYLPKIALAMEELRDHGSQLSTMLSLQERFGLGEDEAYLVAKDAQEARAEVA